MIKNTTGEPGTEKKKKKLFPAVAGDGARESVDAAHFGVPSAGIGLT